MLTVGSPRAFERTASLTTALVSRPVPRPSCLGYALTPLVPRPGATATRQSIEGVLKHESVTAAEAVAVFEEPRRVSKYAANLEQLETGRKIRWGKGHPTRRGQGRDTLCGRAPFRFTGASISCS